MESWTFDQPALPRGSRSIDLRSISNTMARTAIPITHYRILAKQQSAATPRLVAFSRRE
jgi:hypothetical protein